MTKHRRGPWAQAEDRTLMLLVEKYGPQNWVRISQDLVSRSPKQCRERYHQNLKPTLNLEPISPEEGILIERLVSEMGKKWAEIARRLRGRSDNAVKNWWNGGMNRRKRLDRGIVGIGSRESRPYTDQPTDIRLSTMSTGHLSHDRVGPHQTHTQERISAYSHQNVQSRLQPLHILPSNVSHPPRLIDPALPSPSSFSCASRSDSLDGGIPPSLASDHSYSSYSVSPKGCTPGSELPPLSITASRSRRESIPLVRVTPTSTPYALDDSSGISSTSSLKSPPHFHSLGSPYSIDSAVTTPSSGLNSAISMSNSDVWRDQRASINKPSSHVARPAPAQRPLPDFRTISAPEPRAPEPISPPRDTRMNLSSVML